MEILRAIGNTLLVRLGRVVPEGSAAVWVKLEGENPSGSLEDRVALAVIEAAEADGRLRPGTTLIEYTGGRTGTTLALVCAAKGYAIRIVTSDAFSQEKRDHMAALGAELVLVPSEGGKTTRKLLQDMIARARELAAEPLVERPAREPRLDRRLLPAGRGDLAPRRVAWMPSCTWSAPAPPRAASPRC